MKKTNLLGVFILTLVLANSGCSAVQQAASPGPQATSGQQGSGVLSVPAEEGIEVTVYNTNLGVVKDTRKIYLGGGLTEYRFEGVASQINPATVKLVSRDGSFSVLEQNYLYDLISRDKLLEKYLGKRISGYFVVGDNKEPVEGVLLSNQGSELVLQKDSGEVQVVSVTDLLLPRLPEGLIIKPTLQWLIENSGAGDKTAELSYLTSGLSWNADYVIVTNKDDTKFDLTSWVTINNNAGATFKDATLKLVAGDINRVAPTPAYRVQPMYDMAGKAAEAQFAEEQLFEYHMYDLQRRTTLNDKEQKQISLVSAKNAAVEKEYVFDNTGGWWGTSDNTKVQVKLNFKNSKENGLGMPLPKGTVRVFKADSEGKLQLLGEDSIDHTPKDETVRVLVGYAFDIVGERKQLQIKDLGCQHEATWEIKLRNHKNESINVTVLERAYWDWTITSENWPHERESNQKIRWRIPVKANGESTLTYTIRYNYC